MPVVAYDDLDFADVFHPRMTVIAQPVSEIATLAVNLLIGRITGKGKGKAPQRIQVPATFVHRESCGCEVRASGEALGPRQLGEGSSL
jgi:LacI family transcriptional regulator